jgi:hypothetical protein
MDKTQKQKVLTNIRRKNVLEAIKDIGDSTGDSIKRDLLKDSSRDIINQLLGNFEPKHRSGDLSLGQEIEMNDIYSGKIHEKDNQIKQLSLENRLIKEEKQTVETKSNEVKLHLHALMQEVFNLAKTTQNLGEEIEVATMIAPANPGEYHIVFFEKLISYIKDFRKKIEDSVNWLGSSNKRADKKNYWSMYKKKGSSFLLAPDHYLQRSVG